MDLNRLYFQHQIAIMKASAAPNLRIRTIQWTRATSIAGQIARIQRKIGAEASVMWDGYRPSDEKWHPGRALPVRAGLA